MKKTALLLLSFVTLLATVVGVTSCNNGGNGASNTTAVATTTQTSDTDTPNTSKVEHSVQLNQDVTTLETVIEASTPKTEEFDGYSMVTAGKEWQINSEIDYSLYNFMGTGTDLVAAIEDSDNETYQRYVTANKVAYYRVNHKIEEEPIKKTNRNAAEQTKTVGAKIYVDNSVGRLMVYYQEIDLRMESDYSSVTGNTGAFLRVSFHTNLPANYKVNISSTQGDTGDGVINHNNVVPKKSDDGSYVGWGKMTIPYVEAGQYYINFVCGTRCFQSIPITINEQTDARNPDFHLQFSGDWDAITAEGYWDSLVNLFYNTYPRLYQRWANGTEPRTITFVTDPTYSGVAYAIGQTVVVSTDYANANPTDIGFFSHEITHSVQQFNFYYGDGAWFTENMANYGGFRYHHWSNAKYIQLYQDANQSDLYNWNWGAYGDGSKWFFAYLDNKWPTTLDENGNKVRGLLDTLVYEIKNGRLNGAGSDSATDTNNMFNKIIKEVTGFDCMEDIRKQYETEFKSGEWDFVGFGNYTDNFLTENVPYVENPNYPMVGDPVHGDQTAEMLESPVTEGDNLCANAAVHSASGYVNDSEHASKLIDGDLTTKWCSTAGTVKDKTYSLDGTRQWIVIDLGETKTFNTYTIYNTATQEPSYKNMSEWELFVSDDAENWISVDYQIDCTANISSFNIGEQNARYVMLRGYNVDSNVGTVRLYEFQIYNQ